MRYSFVQCDTTVKTNSSLQNISLAVKPFVDCKRTKGAGQSRAQGQGHRNVRRDGKEK